MLEVDSIEVGVDNAAEGEQIGDEVAVQIEVPVDEPTESRVDADHLATYKG